jgi:hypothetical protein
VIPPTKKAMESVLGCLGVEIGGSLSYHIRLLARIPKQIREQFDADKRAQKRKPTFQAWPIFWLPRFGDLMLNNFVADGPSRLLLADDYELFFLAACALNDMFSARSFVFQGKWAGQVMQNLQTLKMVSLFGISFLSGDSLRAVFFGKLGFILVYKVGEYNVR